MNNFEPRPFAFLDIETTGRHPGIHELLEIGVVVTRGDNLALIDSFEVKVRPEHFELAEPEALAINHWSQEGWKDALPHAQTRPFFF